MSRYHNNHNNSNNVRIIRGENARILCVADIRGQLSSLNQLAQQHEATHILHTGDFGFYDTSSLDRLTDKTLRHVVQYSPLIHTSSRSTSFNTHPNNDISNLRKAVQSSEINVISELQDFLDGKKQLQVPVFTVWGACEDVSVLEKFRTQEYKIPNLNIVDESASKLLSVGGLNIRLLGLGGAVVLHKLFDNGEGKGTIAGGQGTMWTTVLQIGELLHTADRVYSGSETRVLMTHHSPGREGLLSQLAHTIKADFTISAGLHFRYGSSYNDFSVSPSPAHFSQKLAASRINFMSIYDVVKPELSNLLTAPQTQLLNSVLSMVESMPKDDADLSTSIETTFKNTWNFNLPDSQFGTLILDVKDGRISEEMRSQGFNFSYRKGNESSREKQRTTSQAQISQESKENKPKQQSPPVQAPRPQAVQTAQTNSAPQKTEKTTASPVSKAPKAKNAAQPAANQLTVSAVQQVAAETPLPPPSSNTPALEQTVDNDSPATPGLWVSPCPSVDRAKELFPASTSATLKQTNAGRQYAYIFFSSVEDMSTALTTWERRDDKEGVLVKEMQLQGANKQQQGRPQRGGRGRGGSFRGRGRGRGAATLAE
ncbi:Ser/Thr protein phosphatase family protein [Taphrina deformans PYCC 5710]|uniref:Ser/Thr protein phosphatase family protein n=1 Tax=Taphrina deformans (strain PYCC 5710 / ATCC 11124 / CBS 356.35 / IMI 108563 / JCM 9778 / NBRC 8474) TaxID=1097556 RepID=R4XB66_TAPDE|nr:Ser/Thr protein phosphatase family protein [Taphrina deformans PYCC 5710]|eukprot:CCG81572.1 Ser/Thr protein phosphatase family protein [Taphrina deformans PYCC 5710]